jgi:hypothetical protein
VPRWVKWVAAGIGIYLVLHDPNGTAALISHDFHSLSQFVSRL